MDLLNQGNHESMTMEELLELGDEALGMKVILNSRDKTLMGIVSFILPDSKRFSIEKVTDPKTGKRLIGMRTFSFQEINNVVVLGVDKKIREKLMKEVYQEDQRGKQLLMKKIVAPHLANRTDETLDEDILLGRKERRHTESNRHNKNVEEITRVTPPPPPPPGVQRPEKWIIIDDINEAFNKSISVIQSENDVSVSLEGQGIGRTGTLAWMSIATSRVIFLFDMVKIGAARAFKAGLDNIMMNENLLKIMHDCRAMEDLLHHQFSINIHNVFDTQAAEVYLYMTNNKGSVPMFASGLPSLLIRYLKLSKHHIFFSHVREECAQNDESVWFERPLSVSLCEGLSRSVMYLRELRLVQMNLMLVDLRQITNLFLGSLRDKDLATVTNMEPHVVPPEVLKLGRRCANNTIDVHDPYIGNSKDSFKIISNGK